MVDKEELLRLLPYDFKTDIYIIKISKFKTNLLFNFKINILIDYDINSKEDINTIFKNIKKIKHFCEKKEIIIEKIFYLENKKLELIKELDVAIYALFIDDTIKKYEFIYDYVCDYLDNDFKNKNICDFKDNKCISRRNFGKNRSNNPLIYGCCYTKKKVCQYLVNYICTIKCISCKLFTCRYLSKRNIKYRINDILLLKLFFNTRQKQIISDSLFTDKEEIINLLIKKKSFRG